MRLRILNESAFGCSSVQSPNAGNEIERPLDHRRDRARGEPRDLRLRALARLAPQAGEPAHGFAEHTVALAGETDVTIVQRIGQRCLETQADAANEIARLVAIENERVHHSHAVAAGIEIQPQRERQPAPCAGRGVAFDLHDRAHRPRCSTVTRSIALSKVSWSTCTSPMRGRPAGSH